MPANLCFISLKSATHDTAQNVQTSTGDIPQAAVWREAQNTCTIEGA